MMTQSPPADIGARRAIASPLHQLFLPGFSATRAGFVNKREAKAGARALGLPLACVRGVCNRFWRGWMLAQPIDPATLRVWDNAGSWVDIPLENAHPGART